MAIDKRVASAAEALESVKDGERIFISGFGGAGFPNVLIAALCKLGRRNLTLIVNSATHRLSLTHELIEAGQVRKVICSTARGAGRDLSKFEEMCRDGKIELVCKPQGSFIEAIRAGGAGIPAFYTPVGVGTSLTKGQEIRRFGGRDHVLEEAMSGDVALVRADRADRYGNLTFRFAQMNFGPCMATAATLAIAEVREAVDEPIPQLQVQLPGVYIDKVVVGA